MQSTQRNDGPQGALVHKQTLQVQLKSCLEHHRHLNKSGIEETIVPISWHWSRHFPTLKQGEQRITLVFVAYHSITASL